MADNGLQFIDYFSLLGPKVEEEPSEEFKQLIQKLKEYTNRRLAESASDDSKKKL